MTHPTPASLADTLDQLAGERHAQYVSDTGVPRQYCADCGLRWPCWSAQVHDALRAAAPELRRLAAVERERDQLQAVITAAVRGVNADRAAELAALATAAQPTAEGR